MHSLVSPSDPTNLIVNFIPTTVDDAELTRVFEQCGPVQLARVIRDKVTGAHKGYGFCKFISEASATAAMRSLNGVELHGRRLKLSYARGPHSASPPPPPPLPAAAPVQAALPVHLPPQSSVFFPPFAPAPHQFALPAFPTAFGAATPLHAAGPAPVYAQQCFQIVPTPGGMALVPVAMPAGLMP